MAATSMTLAAATIAPAREPAGPSMVRRQRRPAPATLPPGHRVGAWRVERELGRGGMAAVYAVTHTRFGKRAALKLCHRTALSSEFTAATFLREARVVHRVDHPGATDVFATGTFDGRPYLVMERLAGESLGELHDRGRLARPDALAILLELCDVLEAAHTAGVVHRDLKLDNVVVLAAPAAAGRRIKLVDWGVAAILDEPDPMHGMIAGTLTYVAPEQVRGGRVTAATDVYSLGVLAYELLLGQPPFWSRSDLELIQLHVRAAPPPPASLRPDIPGELAGALVAMLAKDPAQRPALAEVRRALAAARAPRPPAPPPWLPALSPPDVLGRPAPIAFGRYRVLAAVLGLALTAASAACLL